MLALNYRVNYNKLLNRVMKNYNPNNKMKKNNTFLCSKTKLNFGYNMKHYATQTTEKRNQESSVTGENKNFPPAIQEWPNSIYAYNKNSVRSLAIKDKSVNSIIRSYFNLVPVLKKNTKSKRMRSLIRRSSTKKLFVSKADIKQTNDKVTVTVYTVNREKDFYIKKIFLINKSLTDLKRHKTLDIKKFNNNLINISKIYPMDRLATVRTFNNKTNVHNYSSSLALKRNAGVRKQWNKPFKFNVIERYLGKPLARSYKHNLRDLSKYHWRTARKENRKIFNNKPSYFYFKNLIKTLPFCFTKKKKKTSVSLKEGV